MILNGSVGEVAAELAKLCAPQQKGAETCTYRPPTQQELSRHVRRFGREGIIGVEGALELDPRFLDPPVQRRKVAVRSQEAISHEGCAATPASMRGGF